MTKLTRLRALSSPAEDPAPTGSASAACGVTVRCPSAPPGLPPDAARVLLSILRTVAESDTHRTTSPTPRATRRDRAA
jgi:hypothetical protein